jgi:acyl-CoA synthetase (AMP-forming)/AMP-acid ligase II
VELQVADLQGEVRPAGEVGELWVRGPEVMWGYLEAADTAEALTEDGWFRTGDLATLDDGGWLTIVGRVKELIIRGGENIAASEVESTLEAHPAVAAAVAVGMPDERLGERVAAFVVLDPDAALAGDPFDLAVCQAWFGQRGLARFKTPEHVEVLDALPLLPTGKPDRAALRTRLT